MIGSGAVIGVKKVGLILAPLGCKNPANIAMRWVFVKIFLLLTGI